jgi:CcmD family protein
VIIAQETSALPDNTGYVAAAYLVFFALVLVYVVIMASKLARFERELSELNELADERAQATAAASEPPAAEPEGAAHR